jgi:hypothetical protein
VVVHHDYDLGEASMRLPTLSLLLISAVLLGEMHAASALEY